MRSTIVALVFLPCLVFGQAVSDVVMTIDLENVVYYYNEGTDASKLLTSSTATPLPSTFVYALKTYVILGDITALNGAPTKGSLVARGTALNISTASAAVPQRPIADISRNQMLDFLMEILDSDGNQVGTLAGLGFGAGAAPAGTPAAAAAGNFAIVGGSGAYSGVRGQGATVSASNLRIASAVEDPAYRRMNGGGKWRIGIMLNAVATPEIVEAYHGDFTAVTQSRPAQPGETVILAVRGVGPTRPVLEPGRSFQQDPLSKVASRIDATVNGQPVVVSNRVGWPGTQDLYRIDVTLPAGLQAGSATVVISAAWMPGAGFALPVK